MPFETEGLARGVAGALGVDKELQPNVVRKTVTAETDARGTWTVVASELKPLRSAVSGYYDLLTVSVRTVERFGEKG